MSLTARATHRRREQSGETDWELYEKIDDNPGQSVYGLAKLTGWTPGRVHGAVMRLVEKGLVRTERSMRGGRSVLLVAPKEWQEYFTPEELDEFKQL
ncbi:MAG: MarR family protein [Methanosaeta sp. PtaU1.Bin060]|jgi:DNA-binding MarR family transcriptional regulator|nr:MAG: MarR family protein [Methanosaeta sp. PtaU1.Bin060]